MVSRILIGSLVCASVSGAGNVSSVELIGGQDGTRIRFRTTDEMLSRVAKIPGGLRIDILGGESALRGVRPLQDNPVFSEVRVLPVTTAQSRMLRFEFVARQGAEGFDLRHREWNGSSLDFLLNRDAVAKPFQVSWKETASSDPTVATMASLENSPVLGSARYTAQGDVETIELHFNEMPTTATLTGEGEKYLVHLGKARLTAAFRGLGSNGLLVKSVAASKIKGESVLSLKLSATPNSILLTRSGNVVQVRVVRPSPVEGLLVWDSKSRKTVQLVHSQLPSDEVQTIASVPRSGGKGGAIFSPEGSQAAFQAQGEAIHSGLVGANATEAERLEAERRRSREFVAEQARQMNVAKTQEQEANRVVYNTFGIRDPFIPLEPDDVDGGLNIDQMRVVGIIYSPTRPMAVLEHITQSGLSVALREGDAIQNGRVLRILRDQVVFVLEEFGVSRQFTLKLQVPKGEKS